MAMFDFVAVDAQGRKQKGVREGDNARQVRTQLRDQGLAPMTVEPATRKLREEKTGGMSFSGGISAAELALATRQLATLVAAAMPLEESLRTVAKQSRNEKVSGIFLAVRARVVEGYALAQALSEFPRAFPDLYRATVAAGEKSGHLDLVLEQLADYTETRHDMQQRVRQALIYPAALCVFSFLIVMALLTWVVPRIVAVFENAHQQLPFITRALIALSEFARGPGLLLLVALAVAVWFFRRAVLASEPLRLRVHRRLLRWPMIGHFELGANAARVASTLSILVKSGVPLVEALHIAADVSSNLCIRDAVRRTAVKVTEGGSLAISLDSSGFFPPMMVQMIASGERSGELSGMLARAAQNQDRELSALVGTLISLLGPAVVIMMGGVILMIVMAVMLPIISMNNLMAG